MTQKKSFAIILLLSIALTEVAAQNKEVFKISVDPEEKGPVINRHIFGQFAEHLGKGIYEGVWVGSESQIPNTRGIRNDVVEALRKLKVPNVRWPGGCFADEYHWRDGIGSPDERRSRINASWGRDEPNTFGTHEYFDFLEQIGAEAFVSANVGSGTVQETSDWLEYLTAENSSLAKERAKNGHPEPYKVAFWGIGNEVWGCGGPFTAEEYLTKLKRFANFSNNYNSNVETQLVAVGPDATGFGEYTEVIMDAWSTKSWAWDMHALSLHRYTRNGWPPNIKSFDFSEEQYAAVIEETIGMDEFISVNEEIMDKYDPEKKISILVDEWGTWYAPIEGSDPGYLSQYNSMRDAMVAALNFNIFIRHADRVRGANIAQMINVLQAMILTEEDKMILTPTYHAFHLYVPFQDAKRLAIDFKSGSYKAGDFLLPKIDAVAAETKKGDIIVAIANIDAQKGAIIELSIPTKGIRTITGKTLAGKEVDSMNTFEQPDEVSIEEIQVKKGKNSISLEVAPNSITVISCQKN